MVLFFIREANDYMDDVDTDGEEDDDGDGSVFWVYNMNTGKGASGKPTARNLK